LDKEETIRIHSLVAFHVRIVPFRLVQSFPSHQPRIMSIRSPPIYGGSSLSSRRMDCSSRRRLELTWAFIFYGLPEGLRAKSSKPERSILGRTGSCIIVRSYYIVRPYYDYSSHGSLPQGSSRYDSTRDSPHIYGYCLSRGTRRSVHRAACDRTANEQDRHLRSFWIEGAATVGYGRSRKASLLGAGGTAFAHAPKGYTTFACNAGELDWLR